MRKTTGVRCGFAIKIKPLFLIERPSSGIAGWRCGWIAGIGSEGARPALLPAGPVPERLNVKSVFIETPDGQRLTGRACWAYLWWQCFIEAKAGQSGNPRVAVLLSWFAYHQ